MKWPTFKKKRPPKQQGSRQSIPQQATDTGAYRAVAIVADLEGGCTACTKQRGTRYLMNAAPSLPLKGCDAAECRCRYVRYQDRREEVRRDSDIGISVRHHLAEERRTGRSDRRSG